MRLVIQRVTGASLSIDGSRYSAIGPGLVVLVGVAVGDTPSDAEWLAAKCLAMRIFNDDAGVMNRSVRDVAGEILAVSQFTLCASTRKGNRPSYIKAAPPEVSKPIYEHFCSLCAAEVPTATGVFGADMQVALVNDGPVTIVIDSTLKE